MARTSDLGTSGAMTSIIAALSGFLPITATAWISWQVLEGSDDTLRRSDLGLWLSLVACSIVVAILVTVIAWRTPSSRWCAVAGVVVALAAVIAGYFVDIASSGSLTG
jgi:hypothetical protein